MSGDYQHEPFETFARLRCVLREYGYTPDLDPIIERFRVNHPLWFDGLVDEGLVEVPATSGSRELT
jgi:hypothetical protein